MVKGFNMNSKLQLGAKIVGANEEDLGNVKFLVARPNSDQITHLVIEKGILDYRQVVVPVDKVKAAPEEDGVIHLNLTKDQLEQLPDFIERDYSQTLDSMHNSGILYPLVESPDPATSYMTNFEALPYTEKVNVPSNSLIIEKGAGVEALDGHIGKIKEVQFDPTNESITGFTVEKGLFFHEDFYVPVNLVKSASLEGVFLTVHKKDLQPETLQGKV